MGVMMRELTTHEMALKTELTAIRGYWVNFWDEILKLDAEFLEAYVRFSGSPFLNGVLAPVEKELILVALNASPTHLYEPGLRAHLRNALSQGASPGQIMAVFELASTLGIQSLEVGAPIVESDSAISEGSNETPDSTDLATRFEESGVPWSPAYEIMGRVDPVYAAAYLRLASVAWNHKDLEMRLKELVCIAINASATHLFQPALRLHVRRALDAGVRRQEIMEVLELVSVVGIHACITGVPILLEELQAIEESK